MSFAQWLRQQPCDRNDPLGQVAYTRKAREAWNAAVEACREQVLEYARRHEDIRAAALETAYDNLRRLQSPRICDCCNQPIPEDAP